MALFLKGKYKGFYKLGNSECVRDIFRFKKSAEDKVSMELTRRDMTTPLGKFWKMESSRFTLHPLDESQPRLGGKVSVQALVFDVRTLTVKMKTLYGIYGDDFIQYGVFKEGSHPLDNEEELLKITENIDKSDDISERITFKFSNDDLTFSHDINENLLDSELNHEVEENKLSHFTHTSWSEKLFYGIGN